MTLNNFIIKSAIAAIVIIATVFVFVAGGFAMIRMMDSGNHANCLAAIPGQPDCAGIINSIQFALTHVDALISISLGIIGPSIFLIFVLLIIIALFRTIIIAKFLLTLQKHLIIVIYKIARSIYKQRYWISLLEKRDPYLCRAMNV